METKRVLLLVSGVFQKENVQPCVLACPAHQQVSKQTYMRREGGRICTKMICRRRRKRKRQIARHRKKKKEKRKEKRKKNKEQRTKKKRNNKSKDNSETGNPNEECAIGKNEKEKIKLEQQKNSPEACWEAGHCRWDHLEAGW